MLEYLNMSRVMRCTPIFASRSVLVKCVTVVDFNSGKFRLILLNTDSSTLSAESVSSLATIGHLLDDLSQYSPNCDL